MSELVLNIDDDILKEINKLFGAHDMQTEFMIECFFRRILADDNAERILPFDTEDLRLELDSRAFLLELNANKALQKTLEDTLAKGIPITKYDIVNKLVHFEYPDGHREYDIDKIRKLGNIK